MTAPRSIELLAPARDLDCGLAAIDHGADAVYIGAPWFGARAAAANPLEDIERLVTHAHRYWARVFVAMNTLLTDAELPVAVEQARQLADMGVDGLIVQDVGLLESGLPSNLPLIASTQMDLRDPARVRFLQDVGFARAILARELTLEEIRAVRAAAPEIELEAFVHGALCVGHSGQCRLSYALGGRSGNRGECAQPCRQPYSLVDRRGQVIASDAYLLSLCDLDLSAHVGELIDAGVTSFKIEGRLKNRAYVATVVAYYRRVLDARIQERGLDRASLGRAPIDFEPDPARVFQRGQTSYFLHGRPAALGYRRTPEALGPRVGVVERVRGHEVRVLPDPETDLRPGDGLVFFDETSLLRGTRVNQVREDDLEVQSPEGLVAGAWLHRNRDETYLQTVERSRPRRAIEVSLALTYAPGLLELAAIDEAGVRAVVRRSGPWEPARAVAQALVQAERQLRRTGDTEFDVSRANLAGSPPLHVPVAELNALRRDVLVQLRDRREAARPHWPERPVSPRAGATFPERVLDVRGNVLNERARCFYERHGVGVVEGAAESGLDLRGRTVMTSRYCVLHELGGCPRTGGRLAGKPPFALIDPRGRRLELEFDCAACEMNVILPAATKSPSSRRSPPPESSRRPQSLDPAASTGRPPSVAPPARGGRFGRR